MEFETASVEELQKFTSEKRTELSGLRFSARGSKNRNVKLVSTLRKEIARALTQLQRLNLQGK